MNSNSAKGRRGSSVDACETAAITRRSDRRHPRGDRAPRPSGGPSAGSRRSAPRRSRPRRRARGRSAGSAGKTRLTTSRSCSTATTVRASSCQRRTRSSRSAVVLASMAVKGSSRRMTGGVLEQQAGEQRALHLAAGEGADRAALEAGQADGRERLLDPGPVPAADAAEQARPGPEAHGDEVVDGEREDAVDLRRLRQIGDAGGGAVEADPALERLAGCRRCP